MSRIKVSRNVFGLLFFIILSLFLSIETAAQCSGTYFKRSATTNVPLNGFIKNSADMTGDGIPDLVGYVGRFNPSNSGWEKLFISPANGTGSFGSPITINAPSGKNFQTFIVGNYDNDNLKDILIAATYPSARLIYRNNGNGTFTLIDLGELITGNFLFMLDINNDGKGDLVTDFGGLGADVRFHLGNGDGTFQAPVPLIMDRNIQPGDFNTDGKIDFIAGTTLLINQGNASFMPVSNAITLTNGEIIKDVRDFSGDGKPDIVTVTQNSPVIKVSLLTNLGNNSFQRADQMISPLPNSVTGDWLGNVYVGNFSGNSSPDILYSPNIADRYIVYTNDGAGTLSERTYFYNFNAEFVGDYDNDGKADALRVSEGNFYPDVPHKFFNEASLTVQKNVCNRFGQTRIVDFIRRGATDLSYWTPANGLWEYKNSSIVYWGAESFGDIPTPGDFNGDGSTDYAVYRNPTGDWWIRYGFNQSFSVHWGLPGDKPVASDYDGDGVSDLAVWRASEGNWYILFLGAQAYTVVHWGIDTDKPVPEDYDGDGKTDIAVYRPSTGTWYILNSSNLNLVTLQFGISSDKPVPADYDGDGKADIAVYRPADAYLHILRSANFAYAAFPFGASGDILQPGDYDGDFVFDFGTYRPSDQKWRTTNSAIEFTFGANNIIPTSSVLKIE
jgi:hypothetical protein